MSNFEQAVLAAAKAFVATMTAGGAKDAPAASPKATTPAKPAAGATKPAAKAPAGKPAADDDYAAVKAKILELGAIPATGRAAVAEILKGFGVAKGPDLSADQYDDAIAQLQEKIDELGEQA